MGIRPGMDDLGHDIGAVEELNTMWLSKAGLFPKRKKEDVERDSACLRELLWKARAAFADAREERKDCEKYARELLQFRRALGLTDVENPQLREHEGYEREYDRSMAALRHIVSTVRLHFLLLDLQAIVAER